MFYQFYTIIYQYAKTFRRNYIITFLLKSNIKITVTDKSWKNYPYFNELNYIQASTTEEIIEIYKRSKILFQDMAEFNDGSHCRIADAILCNTMIMSEYSKYIAEKFTKSEIFLFDFEKLNLLPIYIKKFIENDEFRNEYIEKGYGIVQKCFLPKHRAKNILDVIYNNRCETLEIL